ncbi:HIT domain-containing protein [Sphingomonas suaedae]|uniref:HIT domain-containing protein n=1 Tax=Sphingomonas suaedae TaxID=2599297 RepID=A0A518RF77_9SPHN|nr:HIT domain-containing protein [Sphingomonas suaedae]QDX26091.1 HIT domain-containing protein [Sphingomonas suaedae]
MPVDATQPYDDQNIFAKILRGEIPSKPVYEDEFALAIPDINPQAPTHILVLPKGAYVSWDDFTDRASDAEIAGFVRAVGKVARSAGLVAPGYRLLANTGPHAHQTIGHLHVHIFAGRPLGPLLVDPATVDAMIARGDPIG